MIPMSEVPEKHPKLVLMFEQETGYHTIWQNKITKNFKHWINQKIEYKNLICNDPTCPKFGQEFPSKRSLSNHRHWHNKGYQVELSKEMIMFEKETGKHAIRASKITGNFECWMNQRNKKFEQKMVVHNPHNHLTEFLLEFIKKHTYFSKNHVVDEYMQKIKAPKDIYVDINLKFKSMLRYQVKIGVLEKYSTKTYKRVD